MMALLLTGCGASGENADDLALEARGAYLQMETCAASLAIQVDYGSRVYDYGMDVTWEREGETTLTLTAPEEVAGVTGHIAAGETALEFDGMYVAPGRPGAQPHGRLSRSAGRPEGGLSGPVLFG